MAYIVDSWLSENSRRCYPFEQGINFYSSLSYRLKEDVLLDLQLYSATYPKNNNVVLISIVVAANSVTFNFTDNVFVLADKTAVQYPYYFPRLSNGSFICVGSGVTSIPNGTHNFTDLRVEPALTYEYSGSWLGVNQITVSPEFESTNLLPTTPLVVATSPVVFTGDVNFHEGYQFGIIFDSDLNQISLRADKSYGTPIDCSLEFIEYSLKDCDKIISYVNGVPPDQDGVLRLITGQNVSLVDGKSTPNFIDDIDTNLGYSYSANPHTLFVELTFSKTDICAPINTL